MKNTEKKDEELVEIVQPLVNWYRKNKRDLPWRHNPDAYRVWISEIMLQQTRVEAVKGYYDRFLKALPTVKDLAEAEEDPAASALDELAAQAESDSEQPDSDRI